MAYGDKVLEHYENPRNVGSMDKSDPNVGTGLVGAPACGDVMRLQVKIGDDGKILDAKFKTFGCGSAIASSSLDGALSVYSIQFLQPERFFAELRRVLRPGGCLLLERNELHRHH